MRLLVRTSAVVTTIVVIGILLLFSTIQAQNPNFHNAPAFAKEPKNPFDQAPADAKGLFLAALSVMERMGREWQCTFFSQRAP